MGSLESYLHRVQVLEPKENINMVSISTAFVVPLLGAAFIAIGQVSATGLPDGSLINCHAADETNIQKLSLEQLREIVLQCSKESIIEVCWNSAEDERRRKRSAKAETMKDEKNTIARRRPAIIAPAYTYYRWHRMENTQLA